jgi:hypothetical protein
MSSYASIFNVFVGFDPLAFGGTTLPIIQYNAQSYWSTCSIWRMMTADGPYDFICVLLPQGGYRARSPVEAAWNTVRFRILSDRILVLSEENDHVLPFGAIAHDDRRSRLDLRAVDWCRRNRDQHNSRHRSNAAHQCSGTTRQHFDAAYQCDERKYSDGEFSEGEHR